MYVCLCVFLSSKIILSEVSGFLILFLEFKFIHCVVAFQRPLDIVLIFEKFMLTISFSVFCFSRKKSSLALNFKAGFDGSYVTIATIKFRRRVRVGIGQNDSSHMRESWKC